MSDNRYYVNYESSRSVNSEHLPQILAETRQRVQPCRGGFNNLLLGLEDLSAIRLNQNPDGFPDQPAWSAQHLQSVGRRHQQRDAVVPHDSHALGKAIEDLQLESRHVDLLELFRRIRH